MLQEQNRHTPSWINLNKIGVAKAEAMISDNNLDINPFFEYAQNIKIKMHDGWVKRFIGEALMNPDSHHVSESEYWVRQAITADKQNNMRFHLGKDYALYAEFFKRRKDMTRAREHLNKSIRIFKDCGASGWVEKYNE